VRERVQVDLFHDGVLVAATMNADRTVRIEPPLIITEAQINFMIDTLENILKQVSKPKVTPIRKLKSTKKRANA
jgi:4-aminobutyrate aminotransferase-like enzyme